MIYTFNQWSIYSVASLILCELNAFILKSYLCIFFPLHYSVLTGVSTKRPEFLSHLQSDDTSSQLKTLSMTDFAGQCAYYACHQVYLSNRAFYILVVDMSKNFEEKVSPDEIDQKGTHFQDWTYRGKQSFCIPLSSAFE
jgi:hypothetical protein